LIKTKTSFSLYQKKKKNPRKICWTGRKKTMGRPWLIRKWAEPWEIMQGPRKSPKSRGCWPTSSVRPFSKVSPYLAS
jgi:hypothetical protein